MLELGLALEKQGEEINLVLEFLSFHPYLSGQLPQRHWNIHAAAAVAPS